MPTFTVIGHWESDKILVEDVLIGRCEDKRPNTFKWDQGLFAASADGETIEEAITAVRAEYENQGEVFHDD